MPATELTLSSLIVEQRGLRMTCGCRGTVRIMGPLEACASYGALLKFSEVRAALRGRCKAAACEMIVEPTAFPYTQYGPDGERRVSKAP